MFDISEYEAMAKLKLPDDEREKMNAYISELIKSFTALEKIDTQNVEPLVSVLVLNNVMREDIGVKAFARETLLENAPESCGGYFQVPRTLE